MQKKTGKSCYQAALTFLSGRDHSSGELTRKLSARGFDKNEIQAAIEACARLNYVDDRKFAASTCHQLQHKGYGRRHIRHTLRSKKIAEHLVLEVIETCCSDTHEESYCRKIAEKKMRISKDPEMNTAGKSKLYRYLLGRGFAPAVIQRVIEKV